MKLNQLFRKQNCCLYFNYPLLGTLIAGYVLQPYLQSIFDPVVDKLTEDVKMVL